MKIKMHIGTTSYTNDADYMEKLFQVNQQFRNNYARTLRHKQYGGRITGTIIVPISVYEEEGEDQKVYKKMYLEKHKNWDGKWESSIIFRLYINPLLVKRLTLNELHQYYCDLIITQLHDPNFKLPKNFNSIEFKKDFFAIVQDFRTKNIMLPRP